MLVREVDILKRVRHKNIVSIVDVFHTDSLLYIVLELATGFFVFLFFCFLFLFLFGSI